MNEFAIRVEQLSKRYRIGKNRNIGSDRSPMAQKLGNSFGYLASSLREANPDEILWALRDVSFEVQTGEVVGLIGRNGAGKSTLLKVLSRITEPTSGRARIRGRVGSLLEVGTGFHPELTGRENIYHSGAILGMKRIEIDQKFDEIVAFSEVGRFLDTPVKRYSSGMYVRLAFSVAAHLQPEVLLVDEVLAVGDGAFQKKCLGKMGDVAKQGRTVVFVSHNMIAVQNLCNRAIWLHEGRVEEDNETATVLARYLSSTFSSRTVQSWEDGDSAPGNSKARLYRVAIRPKHGTPSDIIDMASPLVVEVDWWNLIPDQYLHVGLHVYTEQQIVAFTSNSNETDLVTANRPLPAGLLRSTCEIPGNLLNAGMHHIMVVIVANGVKTLLRVDDALVFEVMELQKRPGEWYGKEPGAVRPRLDWKTEFS